jgi:hypothetical protein
VWVQFVAAMSAAVYSFVVTAVLVLAIDKTMGFTVPEEQEADGLDRTIHGEVGFDYGGAVLDEVPTGAVLEPKAAAEPPVSEDDGSGFTLAVEGAEPEELHRAWLRLCDSAAGPPSPEFKAVYKWFTTMSGNKFRFRGGNHITLKENLEKVLQEAMDGTAVKVHSDV